MESFFEQNIVVIYFFYGLAFFSMGLAVWVESGRSSQFRLARAIKPLAAFGILHGLHEWLEMFQRFGLLVPGAPALARGAGLDIFRLVLLALSFLMLIIFGVLLIHSSGRGRGSERAFVLASAGVLLAVWGISVIATQRVYNLCLADCLVAIDVLTRYILAIPASLLAAWAMVLEQRAFRERGMGAYGRDLRRAAIALLLYGFVGQLFVSRSVLFPSTIVNVDLFFDLFGFPIQLFRAFAATAMAIFLVRALRAFDLENRQMLAAAREARLAAQQSALAAEEQARLETEALNRRLQMAVQDLTLLFELSRTLGTTLDREALLRRALRQVLESMPRVQAGMILLCERDEEPPKVMARASCDGDLPHEGGLVCDKVREVGVYVVDHRQPALRCEGEIVPMTHVAPLDANGRRNQYEASAKGRTMGVPLVVREQVCGSLVLGVGPEETPFTEHDLSLMSAIAGQLGMAIENATLYKEVQDREALRGELYQRIVAAQERERKRIARELHDGTGQVLTGLGLGLKAAAESARRDPDVAVSQLLELKDLNAQALSELRDLIGDLRPTILDDMGLVPALKAQCQEFERRTLVEAAFLVDGRQRRLSSDLETVIFRITQEALNNIAKHASADHVMVRLIFDEEALQLIVTDDGRGFDPQVALNAELHQRRAWGLLGIQERVMLVGGVCEIASRPGTGTTVRVWVPLKDKDAIDEEDSLDVG